MELVVVSIIATHDCGQCDVQISGRVEGILWPLVYAWPSDESWQSIGPMPREGERVRWLE